MTFYLHILYKLIERETSSILEATQIKRITTKKEAKDE